MSTAPTPHSTTNTTNHGGDGNGIYVQNVYTREELTRMNRVQLIGIIERLQS